LRFSKALTVGLNRAGERLFAVLATHKLVVWHPRADELSAQSIVPHVMLHEEQPELSK